MVQELLPELRWSEFVIPANIPVNGEALEGIELSNIRLSADATDEQVAEWRCSTELSLV